MPQFAQIKLDHLVRPHDAMRFKMDDEKLAELMDSIRHDGVLEPLLVIKLTASTDIVTEEYEADVLNRLAAGETVFEVRAGDRRLLACRNIAYSPVPCLVFEPSEPAYAGLMATENLIREEATAFEEGVLFTRIRETPGITEEEMRRKCGGKSLPYIYDRIALVAGDRDVALAVHEGKISMGVARKLNQIRYPAPGQRGEKYVGEQLENAIASAAAYRAMFLERAINCGASINAAEMWVNDWRSSAGIVVTSNTVPTEPMPAEGYAMPKVMCALCREDGEPHEMETITVHRNELAAFRAALAQQARGEG